MKVCSFVVECTNNRPSAIAAVVYEYNCEKSDFEISWPSEKCETYVEMLQTFAKYLTENTDEAIFVTCDLCPNVCKLITDMNAIGQGQCFDYKPICDIKSVLLPKRFSYDQVMYDTIDKFKEKKLSLARSIGVHYIRIMNKRY